MLTYLSHNHDYDETDLMLLNVFLIQVQTLHVALMQIGRTDLANDLLERDKEYTKSEKTKIWYVTKTIQCLFIKKYLLKHINISV